MQHAQLQLMVQEQYSAFERQKRRQYGLMRILSFRHIVIGIAMFASAALGMAMKANQILADRKESINLEAMIPKQFGDWKIDESMVPLIANPQQKNTLQKIYDRTLSRTYVNRNGERMMLSIAYGEDQRDSMQVHRPEVCYAAQGFQILKEDSATITIPGRELPVKRLVASQGIRIEPITYWITVGNRLVLNGLDKKIAKLRYGMTGRVPDGMLVRISSINPNIQQAYRDQQKFTEDMIREINMETRERLLGLSQ